MHLNKNYNLKTGFEVTSDPQTIRLYLKFKISTSHIKLTVCRIHIHKHLGLLFKIKFINQNITGWRLSWYTPSIFIELKRKNPKQTMLTNLDKTRRLLQYFGPLTELLTQTDFFQCLQIRSKCNGPRIVSFSSHRFKIIKFNYKLVVIVVNAIEITEKVWAREPSLCKKSEIKHRM